jgi:drug/metabolite transporter (DMT)-like permease
VGSIKSLGVAKSGIFIALIPVVTALVSWLLGDNALTLHQGIGIAIAVVGLIISQANKRKDIKNPEQQHVPCDER